MGRAAPLHRISILIVLIAVTVQAIIPDARDLASLRALNLVCLIVLDLNPCSDDCDSTDEECAPPLSDATWELRELARRLATSPLELPGPTAPRIDPYGRRSSSLGSSIVRSDDLIHSHCCLNC
jgi:hypothetical protein